MRRKLKFGENYGISGETIEERTDMGILYYGDNLDVMKRHISDQSVDLVYLDPPFNSNQNYNVLFKEQDGAKAASQILAFEDTWTWDSEDVAVYQEMVMRPGKLSELLQGFYTFLGPCNLMAYVVMMAPRLVELKRVMKDTASIYLHCDPTASHYLKLLMDAVFGKENYRNEIVWKRTGAHNSAKRYGPIHDIILYYSKSNQYKWNQQYQDNEEYIAKRYTYTDDRKRAFYPVSLIAAGVRNGSSGKPWRGIDVSAKNNHWRYTVEKLDALDQSGDIYWPPSGGIPRLKMYKDNAKGSLIQEV